MADIYILKPDGTPVDIVDDYIDIRWSRKFYFAGDFTMRVSYQKARIAKLERRSSRPRRRPRLPS